MTRGFFSLFSVALVCLTTPLSAPAAEPYPSRPIRIVVPYAAGGVVDVQARALTQKVAMELGQPIVVEAKPGANGNIAAEAVARAPADGYTLIVSAPYLYNNPILESNLRWAPKDFVPIARYSTSPSYFVVPANSPARSVKEFVEMAKKANPPLQYGEGGQGSTQSVAMMMLMRAGGFKMEAALYRGAPPIVPDLINGLLAGGIMPSSVAYPPIRSGGLRALANTSTQRSRQLPDVPTMVEAGFPEATALSWYGLHAPAGTPPQIIAKIEAAVKAATSTDEVKERLINAGGEEAFLGTADFQAFMKVDGERSQTALKSLPKQ